jgi:hypothetical protein
MPGFLPRWVLNAFALPLYDRGRGVVYVEYRRF